MVCAGTPGNSGDSVSNLAFKTKISLNNPSLERNKSVFFSIFLPFWYLHFYVSFHFSLSFDFGKLAPTLPPLPS